ncbi:MAG: hypothetical protein LC130_16765, partial [Bryobacterales bacterium]|nr:hypothetical protein [Bryobacterales bacterium]
MNLKADEAKRSARILDVLASYGIEAEKRGRGYMARCPFHDDSTPSLSVDPIKNVFHCFGCNAGGTVIDFVMKKDGLTFREATDKLLVDGGQVRRGSDIAAPPSRKAADVPALSPDERRQVSDVIEHYHRTLSGEDGRGL